MPSISVGTTVSSLGAIAVINELDNTSGGRISAAVLNGDFMGAWDLLTGLADDFFKGDKGKLKSLLSIVLSVGFVKFFTDFLGVNKTFSLSNPIKR